MSVERTVLPNEADITDFEHGGDDRPIVMVNLLRFREQADYTGLGVAPPRPALSGKKAYARYSRGVIPLVWKVGGQILWSGKVRSSLILPSYESWDQVALVWYPNRQAFSRMVTSEAYERIGVHRTASLEDSRLLETRALKLPRPVLATGRLIMRVVGAVRGV